ncbi:hypothetical protein [Asaia spathodeae]|uniref:Uncharacterized protein n=1 Tax=Asaia spathodeae TaxID=657016 RepID=A0ABX2P7Y9_9PROT|nr:hypothetical protein [Asaia spathodeae]GBR20979.1 hypothetical protein AA105894_2684 [Asaia spathodeae NBRC 105894]
MSDSDWHGLIILGIAALLAIWIAVSEIRSYLRCRDLRAQIKLLEHLEALSAQTHHRVQGTNL